MSRTDIEDIQAVVHEYFDGLYRMDQSRLRRAFHPEACLFGHLRGNFTRSTLDQWLEKIGTQPVPAESGEPFDMRIVSADVTGEAATVKVAELYRGLRFTDYLTFLRVQGRWVIVNKAYHHD